MPSRQQPLKVINFAPRLLIVFLSIVCTFLSPRNLSASPSDTLVITSPSDPKTFNPILAQETSSTAVSQFIFQGLTRLNPLTGDSEPQLAESWVTSADGLLWTFKLRSNLHWNDGTPFTSEDVLFTFNDLLYNPAIPAAARDLFFIQGEPIVVSSSDEQHVTFTLPKPFAPFLMALSQPILPKHRLHEAVRANNFLTTWDVGSSPKSIVGTGPYRIKKYYPGERVELERNPEYWRVTSEGERLPYIEKIIILIISSPDTRLLKFIEGETDLYSLRGHDYPLLKPMETARNFFLFDAGAGMGSDFLAFNHQNKDTLKQQLFRDRRFRRAVAHAIDRKSIIDVIFNRLAVEQCSPLSPAVPFFYNAGVPCYDYDPNLARHLLEEAGIQDLDQDGFREDADGHAIAFTINTNADNPDRVQAAAMIREDLARVGLKVSLRPLEFNNLVVKLTSTGEWDAILIGLTGSIDPHFGANVWLTEGMLQFWKRGAKKYDGWEREIDAIFNAAMVEMDRNKRKKLYDQWQVIGARELPFVFTAIPKSIFAIRDRFENIQPSAIGGPLHNIDVLKIKRLDK